MAVNTGSWNMVYLVVGCWMFIFQQPKYGQVGSRELTMQETWILRKMVGPILLLGSLGGLTLAMVIAGSKRNKRENDDNSSTHSSQSDDTPDDIEVASPKSKSKRALKKNGDESSGNIVGTPLKDHYCRFCNMKFDKSQALGGHMNRHRLERENEALQKAKDLVTEREQHYGGPLWSMQGAAAGSPHHGGNLLPHPPAEGASSRPYFSPNQPASTVQNWQLSQILATQQTSYSLQSQSQAGGSYYNPLHNARPHQGLPLHPQAHHTSGVQHPAYQQLRVNPGQHSVQHMAGHVLQSGADIAGLQRHGPSSFYLNQAGPSPVEEVVLGSTNPLVSSNNPMTSFVQRSPQSNIQFVDSHGNIPPNSGLTPLNETHFQPGHGQGHNFQEQHYASYDQKPGSSTMGSLGSDEANQVPNQAHNRAPGSGNFHMPSFQDTTTDQLDNFHGGNDHSTTAVTAEQAGQASLEGSPDISSDAKLNR